MSKFNFEDILLHFGIDPDSCHITEFKQGHINDSYIIDVIGKCRFFLQRINHHVFRDPEGLMENLIRVNEAMQKHFGKEANPYPSIRPSRNKKYFHVDTEGNFWRLMDFVHGSRSFNIAENIHVAREGASAFSLFQSIMNKENTSDYLATIPDFHHLSNRLRKLEDAMDKNPMNRLEHAYSEITFALDRFDYGQKLSDLLRKKVIPFRVTHNDTKLNNVLFRDDVVSPICVVDLDTVMPGTVLYDYGDMVRTFTSPVEEDEPDSSKVIFRVDIFEGLTDGYLSELKYSLTDCEKENLLFGAKVMLLMIGVRFLTDFLEGDHYFKISRGNHNLDRCKNQFVLLKQLEEKENELQGIIRRYS